MADVADQARRGAAGGVPGRGPAPGASATDATASGRVSALPVLRAV
jgi:hypothetical protein